MKKSVFLILAVLLIVTLFFVACNNKDPQQPSGSNKDTTAPGTEAHVHTFGEWVTITAPTCTEQGRQQRECDCGETETQRIDALGHAISDWKVMQEPTCEGSGYQTQTCSRCNQNVHEDIPPKGHSFNEWEIVTDSTCTEIGKQKRVCSACNVEENAEIPAKGHSFGDYVQTLAPTCTEQGEDTRTCTVCAHTETEAIPANGHSFVDYICSVCNVVAPEKAVQTVRIANDPLLLPMNTEVKLDIQVYPLDALYTTITYTIDERNNSCGAAISEDGVLSCTQLGSVRIRVTVDNVSSAYVTFNVPKEVHTAEEFDAIRNDLKGHYILCNDIDLSAYSTWTPIGYATKAADGSLNYSGTGFQGQFDGNGYKISGVNIDLAQTDLITVGLFGFVDTSATVSNLKVAANVQGNVKSAEYIGTLTGVNYGVIKNCEVSSTMDISGALYVGGIVGQNNGNLTECTANVAITASNSNVNGYYVGGIAGQFVIGNMGNNTVKANIEITSCNFCYVGGVTGNAYGSFSTTDCDATIVVSSGYRNTSYVGGVIGKVEDSDTEIVFDLNNVPVSGSIKVNEGNILYVGGIAGYGSVFNNCINDIDITITNSADIHVGGIVGKATKITNSTNNGALSVSSGSSVYAGGIAGRVETLDNVTNYADIDVTAHTAYFGGVAGHAVSATNAYNYCYCLSSTAVGSFGGVIGECTQTIENAYNTANLLAYRANGLLYIGGVVGDAGTSGNIIKDVTNSGRINVDVSQLGVVYIGGIAGEAIAISNAKNSATDISVLADSVILINNAEQLNVGGLCGYASGAIENSYSYASITLENSAQSAPGSYKSVVGGLAGTANNVSNSYATGDISISLYNGYVNAGGLVGVLKGIASDSYARGSVTGMTSNEIKLGGLVAYAENWAIVQNCYAAYNNLTTNITTNGNTAYVGGLVAHNLGIVTDSYAMNYINTIGSGSGDTIYAGGVIGYNDGKASNSYSASATEHVLNTDIPVDIDCTSNLSAKVYVGGFVGFNKNSISNCYANAEVIGRGCYTGGFVGYQEARGNISHALALAPVNSGISGQTHTGGFAGNELGTYVNCIFSTTGTHIDASNGAGGTTVNGIVGKSETDLLVASNLSEFDTSVWTIASGSIPTLTLTSNWKVYNDGYDNFNVLVNVVNPDRQYVKVSDSTVEIKFESNWELPLPENVVLEKGAKITMLPDLTAEGYFFVGWFTDAVFTQPFVVDRICEVTQDMILYAYFRKVLDVPTSQTYTYNATDITLETLDLSGAYYVITGTATAKVVGNYTVTLQPTRDFCWSDGDAENKIVSWTIGNKSVTIPENGIYIVSGNAIVPDDLDQSGLFYAITGEYKATAIGDYSYTIALLDKTCSTWLDGTTDDKVVKWSIVNGMCGEDVVWQFYETGELIIKGSGTMYMYEDTRGVPWSDVVDQITAVTIGGSVTSIGDYAFSGCTGLINVTIGNRVTSIGNYAFQNCTDLTSITIPDSVTSIGDSAFSYCTDLTSITIPDSVTSIGDSAFRNCIGLTSVTIGSGVTSIGYCVFYHCTGLTNITIPDCVMRIDEKVFYGCTGLTSVTIGSGVTSIGFEAFGDCIKLVEVINHSTLYIRKGSEHDGKVAYYAKEVHGGQSKIVNVNGYLFYTYKDIHYLLGYAGTDTELTLLSDYNGEDYLIYMRAFYRCSGLTSITIPDSVTSIGDSAFEYCTGLTSVTIGSGVTSIGDHAFSNCIGLTSITIPDSVISISESAFSYCTGLTSITIPDSVTSIGPHAFSHCTGLTSVTIGSGVTSIGSYTFQICTGLTSITIPDSVTRIVDSAFYNCTDLTDVYYTGTEAEWAAIWIKSNNECLTNATIHYNWTGEES